MDAPCEIKKAASLLHALDVFPFGKVLSFQTISENPSPPNWAKSFVCLFFFFFFWYCSRFVFCQKQNWTCWLLYLYWLDKLFWSGGTLPLLHTHTGGETFCHVWAETHRLSLSNSPPPFFFSLCLFSSHCLTDLFQLLLLDKTKMNRTYVHFSVWSSITLFLITYNLEYICSLMCVRFWLGRLMCCYTDEKKKSVTQCDVTSTSFVFQEAFLFLLPVEPAESFSLSLRYKNPRKCFAVSSSSPFLVWWSHKVRNETHSICLSLLFLCYLLLPVTSLCDPSFFSLSLFLLFSMFIMIRFLYLTGCSVINVSCADIKTSNGFKFPYNCFKPGLDGSMGHSVEISDNKVFWFSSKICSGESFVLGITFKRTVIWRLINNSTTPAYDATQEKCHLTRQRLLTGRPLNIHVKSGTWTTTQSPQQSAEACMRDAQFVWVSLHFNMCCYEWMYHFYYRVKHTCMPSPHELIGHQKRKERTKADPELNWISTITSEHQNVIKQMYLSSFPGLRNKASSFKHIEIKQPLQLLLIRAPKYFRVLSIDFMK